MTSLRALLGQPVIARDTADRVGTLDGVVIDPETGKVVAVQLGAKKSSRFIRWDDVSAVGSDAIMITHADSARDAHGSLEERAAAGIVSLLDTRMLDDRGDELGTVDDLEFDETTGTINGLHVGDQQVAGDRLIGIGSYAIVATADALTDDDANTIS
jgi:sporulation protein YlmC with PRC-barrel domain